MIYSILLLISSSILLGAVFYASGSLFLFGASIQISHFTLSGKCSILTVSVPQLQIFVISQ